MVNRYKKFFIKLILFALCFLGVDYLSGYGFRYLENKALLHSPYGMVTEYTMWDVSTDILIMGASEANHSYVCKILEDSLGMTAYNCGKDGCRFFYQNAMINGILDRYVPKIIIWSISPGELTTPSKEDDDNLSQLNPFYHSNEYCRDIVQQKSKYEYIKMCLQTYVYNSRFLPFLFKSFMSDYQYERGGYAPLYGSDKNLKLQERRWENSYDTLVGHYFKNTITRCQKQGAKLVFVFTPRFEIERHDTLLQYIELKRILKEQDVELVEDLYHHEDLMNPVLFKDNAHLNDSGAQKFTKMLVEKIKE